MECESIDEEITEGDTVIPLEENQQEQVLELDYMLLQVRSLIQGGPAPRNYCLLMKL